MKFENAAIDGGKNILEFQVLAESPVVTIKAWEGFTNICIRGKKCFEHIPMVTRKLGND